MHVRVPFAADWSFNPESRDTGGLLEQWTKGADQPDTRKLALLRRIPATHILTRAERRDHLAPMPPAPPHPWMPPHPPSPPLPRPPPPHPPPPPSPRPPYGSEGGGGEADASPLLSAAELRASRAGGGGGGDVGGSPLDGAAAVGAAGGGGRGSEPRGGAGSGWTGGGGGVGGFLRRLAGGMGVGLLMLTALKAYGARVDVSLLDRINAAYGRRYGRPIETAADDVDNDNEEPFDDGPSHGSGGSEVKSEAAAAAAAAAVAVVGIAKEAPRGSDDHGGDAKGEHGRGGGDSEDEPPSSGSSSRQGVPQGGMRGTPGRGTPVRGTPSGPQRQRSSLGARAAKVGPSREFTFD